MTRGTTPTLIFNFCDCAIDLRDAQSIIVSFSQGGKKIFDKKINVLEQVINNKILLHLTQEETLLMKANEYVRYQVAICIYGEVMTTSVYKSMVLDILNEDILNLSIVHEVRNE